MAVRMTIPVPMVAAATLTAFSVLLVLVTTGNYTALPLAMVGFTGFGCTCLGAIATVVAVELPGTSSVILG